MSVSSNIVDQSLINEKWINYGNFLEENTEEGKNLYWSIGKKNNHLDVHLWALEFIETNKKNFETNEKLSEKIKAESMKKFPNKTMEGIRALFFSQLLGLIETTYPFKVSKAYNTILKEIDNIKNFETLITNQLEKFYFWNNISSLTNRHTNERRNVDKIFKIYPIFFLYEVFYELENFGYDNYLTKFEIHNFVFLTREHSEINDVVQNIISFREDKNIYEVEKYLKQKNKMDSRFYNSLKYCKYFNFSKQGIELKIKYKKEIESKVENFRDILYQDKLINFDKDYPNIYKEMLYSNNSLIEYHRNFS